MKKPNQTRQVIKKNLPYLKGRILDLGAGSAKYKDILNSQAVQYTAYDVKPGQKIDVVGDILKMPFDNDSFETVVCTMVFEHIPQPWLAAKEIKRILAPTGICLATAPFIFPYHNDPGDYYRYTPQGLAALFESAGFKIIVADYYTEAFSTLAEFIKMKFFNPYQGKDQGFLRSRLLLRVQKICHFFDRFVKTNDIYAACYVIAQKT